MFCVATITNLPPDNTSGVCSTSFAHQGLLSLITDLTHLSIRLAALSPVNQAITLNYARLGIRNSPPQLS